MTIVGDREVYVRSGSAVTLRCKISNCLEKPSYVFWYYGDDYRILDDSDRIPTKTTLSTTTTLKTTPRPAGGGGGRRNRKNQHRRKNRRRNGGMGTLSKYVETILRNQTMSAQHKIHSVFSRGGIEIATRVLPRDGASAVSQITIKNPTPDHSGTYSCRPANLEPAHVKLHVIKGEVC